MGREVMPARLGVAALVLCASPAWCHDEALKAKAREVLGRNKDVLVWVKGVVSEHFEVGGRQEHENESKIEVEGTVIDPAGLIVLSAQSVNPSRYSMSFTSGGDRETLESKSKVSQLKIVRSDGSETPADLIFRDEDLDLAFARPKAKPKEPWPFLALKKPAAEPRVLDDVILPERLGADEDRVETVHIGEIWALVRKPRLYYACWGVPGWPGFNTEGETLGLFVYKKAESGGGEVRGGGVMLLPASEVLDALKQVPAEKGR